MTAPTLATFKLRRGRVTPTQAAAIERLWPEFGVAVDGRKLDLELLFGRSAPVVLEIGFGMGETTAQLAAAAPHVDVLAVDVHTPGIGNLLKLVEASGLRNLRVADGDALVLLERMLGEACLNELRVFFPDPWPKTRHAKRRLVTPNFCDLAADRLAPGGLLHVATDWEPYARRVRRVLTEHEAFMLLGEGDAPARPTTRFERQALDAGRASYDIAARRRG